MNDGAWFGPDRMDSDSGAVAVQALASVAVTVNVDGPAAVGVPDEDAGAPISNSPPGSVPAVTVQVMGARAAGLRERHGPIRQRYRAARHRRRRDRDRGARDVVNGTTYVGRHGVSGGSFVSASVIALATTRSVQRGADRQVGRRFERERGRRATP